MNILEITEDQTIWVENDGLVYHAEAHCADVRGNTHDATIVTEGKFPCGTCVDVDVIPTGAHSTRLGDNVDRPAATNGGDNGGGRRNPGPSPKQEAFIASLRSEVGEEIFEQVICIVTPDGRRLGKAEASEVIDRLLKARDAAKAESGAPTWSDKQDAFLRSLFNDRDHGNDFASFDDFIAAGTESGVITWNGKMASSLIDLWKQAPYKARKAAAAPANGVEVAGLDLSEVPNGMYAVPGGDTRLKVQVKAVTKGKWEGWIFVSDGAAYGEGQRYGSQKPGQAYQGKIEAALATIASDWGAAAAEYGRITSTCGFCSRPLETEESVAAGYGPTCAERHGLPWG
jgi:hypothetical protein